MAIKLELEKEELREINLALQHTEMEYIKVLEHFAGNTLAIKTQVQNHLNNISDLRKYIQVALSGTLNNHVAERPKI